MLRHPAPTRRDLLRAGTLGVAGLGLPALLRPDDGPDEHAEDAHQVDPAEDAHDGQQGGGAWRRR